MHELSTIKARNADRMRAYRHGQPAPAHTVPGSYRPGKTPMDASDPLPAPEAHPYLGDVDTAAPCGG